MIRKSDDTIKKTVIPATYPTRYLRQSHFCYLYSSNLPITPPTRGSAFPENKAVRHAYTSLIYETYENVKGERVCKLVNIFLKYINIFPINPTLGNQNPAHIRT